MIVSATLLKDLQKRVTLLEDDLRRRCDADPQVNAPLQAQYTAARESKRTAETFNAWRDEQITQIAVAWVLACVFVRFLEDNQLLDTPFLAGPEAARMNRARDEQELFFKQHPTASERDYLLHVFGAVGQLPGMKEFFDRRHNPLWLAGPTGDALAGLLDFWRKTDPDTGMLLHDFSDPAVSGKSEIRNPRSERTPNLQARTTAPPDAPRTSDFGLRTSPFPDPTRFLGDLYQDLSEFARKRYALLQTPVFVEQFILDRTLTPAIDTFGYRVVRMLDLTCGSGHFLLGGFGRLFKLWQEHEPGENPRVLAQRALDQVCGVDLNPNVVAIARFRLLLAALRACQPAPDAPPMKLKDAPDFRIHLAVGDSLLHGARFDPREKQARQQTLRGDELFRDELLHFYDTEDREALHRILGRQYHVVVGNPPYITVKDKALNQLYRDRFDSCHRKYSLAAPFMERFFDFAIRGEPAMKWNPFAQERDLQAASTPSAGNAPELSPGSLPSQSGSGLKPAPQPKPAGYVGMITANSFMKREFGSKLIEECIPRWDLTHVIDTDKACIPGHATGTVILLGKHQQPVAPTIRTVMGIKKQEPAPKDPAHGLVWAAILLQVDQAGSESEYITVADPPREGFHRHPWSIGGGGASELKELLDEACEIQLESVISEIGIFGISAADDVFCSSLVDLARQGVELALVKPLVDGDQVRDWTIAEGNHCIFPYGDRELIQVGQIPNCSRRLWSHRTMLGLRATFSKKTYFEEGRPWWEWHQVALDRLDPPSTICFGEIATHNHSLLDHGGRVFNRTAPIIKLSAGSTIEEHLSLVGLFNSSSACFWLKQVCHDKGGGGIGGGISAEMWEHRFVFNGTQVSAFPIPDEKPLALARDLDRTAQELKAHGPDAVLRHAASQGSSLRDALATARQQWSDLLQRMIALQEELDWECYRIYGLLESSSRREGALTLFTGGKDEPRDLGGYEGLPPLRLGERAFEIVLARKLARGEAQTAWFERHGSTPITELPAHWPAAYRALVERRLALIACDRNIALIEQPEYKRRWNTEPWDDQQDRALRQWLLNRLEACFVEGERVCRLEDGFSPAAHGFRAATQPALVSTNQFAELVQADAAFLKVAEVYVGAAGFSVPKLVRELVEAESVPFLPFQRYKESGLRKRQDWERTWELQRKEDEFDAQIEPLMKELEDVVKKLSKDSESPEAPRWKARKEELGEEIRALKDDKAREVGVIPVPPKYASADFKASTFWRLRGKLDVPKERWVSYPGAEREGDPSPVIAWAGWNHLQQAQALAEYYITAKDTWGWPPKRLALLLAGLSDLLPWLKQWHNDLNPEYGMGLGDYFAGFLDEECRKNGTTAEAAKAMRMSSI